MNNPQTTELFRGINELLASIEFSPPPFVLFLTGSSGCGKTFLCEELVKQLSKQYASVLHSDQIGVPPEKEMIEKWGSGFAWHEAEKIGEAVIDTSDSDLKANLFEIATIISLGIKDRFGV